MHVTGSVLNGAIIELQTKDSTYAASRAVRAAAYDAQQLADDAAATFIQKASNMLKNRLGQRWSELWQETGFPNQSTAVPNTLDERMMLLRNLELFFTAHADQPVASQNLTATQAATLHNNLAAARNAVNASLTDAGEKKEARDRAEEMLVKAMRGLIKELTHLLTNDDPRWRRFGLKRPADPELAEVVSGVVVEGAGAGHLFVRWSGSTRAERYRLRKQVVGTDADFVDGPTVTDLAVNMNTFPSGAKVRVQVVAANEAGDSVPSETVEATVP
jgi:hypothetical protein